ncbi:hypothetical protein AYM40_12580 [Paraburkholderia phytofirmans OLGA172]|uniref:Uncharacterized protein n=1 Tax=Paraburkholderia phytofirmans OLGA172 TaxID=1417228 RepID=A0A160FKY7_9BURK|nr:hypothetical protein AYM40_12580 [Paraburkholderia phytofirmans OLGA172]
MPADGGEQCLRRRRPFAGRKRHGVVKPGNSVAFDAIHVGPVTAQIVAIVPVKDQRAVVAKLE